MLLPKRVKYRKQMRGRMTGKASRGPAETRMGKGKGSPEYWVAVVKPGRVMFEIGGVSEEVAREALRLASHKLPIKTKMVKKVEAEKGGEA